MGKKERMSSESVFERLWYFKERKIRAAEKATEYWKERGTE